MLTFYIDRFIPADSAACTRGPVIFIRSQYQSDFGLLAHEMEHRRQWMATLGFHSLLYLLLKPYRQWAEVRAYRIQLSYPPASNQDTYRRKYAGFISHKYGLDISEDEAYALLA